MHIFAREVTGKTTTIECEPNATIGELKQKIGDATGILVENVKLTFSGNALEDNGRTLSDLNIQDSSTLHVIRSLKVAQIVVKIQNGNGIAIKLEEGETAGSLKEKIKSKVNSIECDKLLFDNQELDDNTPLATYGVKTEAILNLVTLKKPEILIRLASGKIHPIPYDPNQTVASLKQEIAKIDNTIIPEEQRLIFNSHDQPDTSTLSACRIIPGSMVHLLPILKEYKPKKDYIPNITSTSNSTQTPWPLIAFLGTTLISYLALPRCVTYLRPGTVLPPVILIPISVILGLMDGCYVKSYQEQQGR